jgi:hypothetical protein
MTIPPCSAKPLDLWVRAWAYRSVSVPEIAPLRKSPSPRHKVSPSLLKHADEQTVLAVAALFEAIDSLEASPETFREWGVLGAPRFIGRDCIGQAIPEYTREGPWSVSPHIVPHRSLHSTSGTLSLALSSGGPNHGVGGGPSGESEGLLAALAMLHERPVPGVWLSLSRVTPLERCDCTLGRPADHAQVEALVLALTREGPGRPLRLLPTPSHDPAGDLEAVRRLLEQGRSLPLSHLGMLIAA